MAQVSRSSDALQNRIPRKSQLARKKKRKQTSRIISVSPFGTPRSSNLGDSNIHGAVVIRPTMSACGSEETLQHKVRRLGNEIDFLRQRVRRLEQETTGYRKTSSSSSSYRTLPDIKSAREDWCRLLTEKPTLAAAAVIRNDIPSFGPHEDEDDPESSKPVKTRTPTCSKLYCTNLTIAFKGGAV